jgi:dTDP-4-dehydrorhamnose reductase
VTGKRSSYLVVGGDSLVGGETVRAFQRRGLKVFATTRRAETLSADRILLDFERPETYQVPEEIGCALVIAAATNYERCATDPMARKINVELIPDLVVSLIGQGVHVIFISTNSVFGGEQPWPDEDAPHRPGIPYAEQKSLGEAAIHAGLNGTDGEKRLSIVRLTKILNHDVSPLPGWRAAWERGETVEPFEDLIFAPMSVTFCAESLVTLAQKRPAGNLHLSGAENVTYVQLAHALAQRFGADPALIRPTTSKAKGIHIAFLPTYSGLGMPRTARLTGVLPQPLDAVIADIFPKDAA